MKTKAIFNWSGGKDSALALYKIVEENRWNIVSLLTSINQSTNRVSMHGIGRELLRQQAENMNFPLAEMYLSENISMEDYDERMNTTLQPFVKKGVNTSIFGDIHLDDLKNYREEKLHKNRLERIFSSLEKRRRNFNEGVFGFGFQNRCLLCE